MVADGVAPERGKMASQWDGHACALLADWRQRVAAASEAHYRLASRLRRRHLLLGIPVVIFSSIVGTSLFATLADPKAAISPTFKIGIASISLAAAILSALQTFLRFGERAEKHVIAGDWYAALRREVDQTLALPAEERGKPKECFDRIRKEMSKVGQQSPEIGDLMWKRVAATYGVDIPLPPRGAS